MHYLIKQFVPPVIHTLRWYSFKFGWKGDYISFEAAAKKAKGYHEQHILDRIIETTKKVVQNEVVYERDGILYDSPKMNFNLLNSLLWVASQKNNHLTVLDFGGSLGTTYHQNLPYLSHIQQLNWCIVEQPNHVEAGKKYFETDQLHFFYSISECLKVYQPDIIIICGALQYIENAYALLASIKNTTIPYLLLDYMAYNDEPRDRITIQHVPPIFYGKATSYPCWFFDKQKMFDWLNQYYTMVYEFVAEPDRYYIAMKPFQYKGQLWKLQ